MFSGPRKIIAFALATAVLFAVGLTQLFVLRFKAGDVYPPYSSLRTDPLGTRVLYESLNLVAAESAQRNFRSPDHITMAPDITVVVTGLRDHASFLESRKFGRLMTDLSSAGGRLVLTFTSQERGRGKARADEPKNLRPEQDSGEKGEPRETGEEQTAVMDDDKQQWLGAASMGFEIDALSPRAGETPIAARGDSGPSGLPSEIPWRSAIRFVLHDEAWQTLYACEDQPVIVSRPWGRATVVMMADSYLLSNEALRRHRQTGFLGWLTGVGHQVVFDEFHHGLSHQPGIAALARRYRLHGVFGALLVVALLFSWRQAAVFVPLVRDPEAWDEDAPAAGRDTGEGLVDLARGHIDKRQLLTVCHDAWLPYFARRVPENVAAEIQALVQQTTAEPKQHNPVEIYRRICQLLKKGKRGI